MKTINKFLILIVSLTTSALLAQSDHSNKYPMSKTEINTFVQKFEGAGEVTTAVQSADGGYVMVSSDNSDFLVMKFKASGQKQWERRLTSDVIDIGSIDGIAQTRDGGFVLAGQLGCNFIYDCEFEPPSGAILVKLHSNGTVAWKKSLAVNDFGFARLSSVIALSDGGVIAIGEHPGE
jgi:hypothetical protein